MFRRRRRAEEDESAAEAEFDQDQLEDGETGAGPAPDARTTGPWDVDDLDRPRDGRIDLGALLVPAVPGMELQVEVADERIISATALLAQSQLKMQAFAAPRTEGIWDEIRGELKGGISGQGGTVDEVDGPFGRELRARVPTRGQGGKSSIQATRFFGIDGPRWFLHAALTGRAATEPAAAGPVEDLLREVVVVRGGTPMPPRELIPMRLPEDSTGVDEPEPAPGRPSLDPFRRGPEITEIH